MLGCVRSLVIAQGAWVGGGWCGWVMLIARFLCCAVLYYYYFLAPALCWASVCLP